jgi:hypothetical protein
MPMSHGARGSYIGGKKPGGKGVKGYKKGQGLIKAKKTRCNSYKGWQKAQAQGLSISVARSRGARVKR